MPREYGKFPMKKARTFLNNFYKPTWWGESAIPYAVRKATREYSKIVYSPDAPACRVMDEDWDNIVILDACRYDQFETLNSLSGVLESRTSLGSATPEFLVNNFDGETYYDTVYITANPMYRTKGLSDVFHEVIDVWQSDWDEEHRTVFPEAMAESTLRAYHEYPNKRIIAHFMQPHYPFIGESADMIGEHAGYELTYRRAQGNADAAPDHPSVWTLLEEGKLDEDIAWKAYNENLELVLDAVEDLIEEFSERTVITSDHGNFVGERLTPFGKPQYGHPIGVQAEVLRKVPWLVIEKENRKNVIADASITEATEPDLSSENGAIVSDRLADLGYID